MRISKISASNIHGTDFSHELQGANVLVGKNFSGKTAVAKAIRLVLTGQLPPPIGVRGVYQLAGNPHGAGQMSVHLETDNGRCVDLSWTRSDKGSVAKQGNVPDDLKLPELLCDVRQFFGMTSENRIKAILAASDVSKSGFGPDSIIRRLSEISFMPRATCEAQIGIIEHRVNELFDAPQSAQESANLLIDWLKKEAKSAKASDEQISGSFAGLKLKQGEVRPADKSCEIAKLESELSKTELNAGFLYQRKEIAVERAKEKLSELGISGVYAEAVEQEMERIDSELAKLEAESKKLSDTPEPEGENVILKIESLQKQQESLKGEIASLNGELAGIESLVKTVVRLELCDDCRTKLTDKNLKQTKALHKKQDAAKEKLAAVEKELVKLHELWVDNKTHKQEHTERLLKLTEQMEDLTDQRTNVNNAYSAYLAASKELKNCPPAPDNSALNAKLAQLRLEQQSFTFFKANQKRMDELEAELVVVRCKAEVFSKAAKLVVEEQSKLIDHVFGDVLKVARHFTDGLLNSPLEFHQGELGRRVSAEDAKIGNKAPVGSWISHETFSDTETLVSYAGFSIALCQHSPIKLVVMDELNVVHSDKRKQLLERMVELVDKGVIDQFIGLAPEIMAKVDGVNYIEL